MAPPPNPWSTSNTNSRRPRDRSCSRPITNTRPRGPDSSAVQLGRPRLVQRFPWQTQPMATAYKWLPIINEDCCTGCGNCVEVCDNHCLEMVWSYARLLCPASCGSEGTCQEACPEDAIHMEWVATAGDQDHGRWQLREDPPPPAFSRLAKNSFRSRRNGA